MKKQPWFDVLENLSLVGVGVGSIASLLFQQILYTTAPLSVLAALGVINRRRHEQQSDRQTQMAIWDADEKLNKQITVMNQVITALPPPEALDHLRKELSQKNREIAGLQSEISDIQQNVEDQLLQLERDSLSNLRQDARFLNEKFSYVLEDVAQLKACLTQLLHAGKFETLDGSIAQLRSDVSLIQTNLETLNHHTKPGLHHLQEQVARLDRRLSTLPPPIDSSSLKQEVSELIRIIADLVPRRDFATLSSEVNSLQHQQTQLQQTLVAIESAAVSLQQQLVSSNPSVPLVSPSLPSLSRPPAPPQPIYSLLQAQIAQAFEQWRSQLSHLQLQTETLTHQLQDYLTAPNDDRDRASLAQPASLTSENSAQSHIQWLFEFDTGSPPHELSPQPSPDSSSPSLLSQALSQSQERLLLVFPWSNQSQLDPDLMQQLDRFLSQGRQLDLGWCHIHRSTTAPLLSKIQRGWFTATPQTQPWQTTLQQLLHLKRLYPNQFQFKIIGTPESFLVIDRQFAVLSLINGLKTTATLPDLHLKLRITDPPVLKTLIDRFEQPHLAADDLAAYWNRAITRYDLGDKPGALADFSHLIDTNPTDAIAYHYRALVYYDLNDPEGAYADLTRSIQQQPTATAYCNRGFITAEQGEFTAAHQDFDAALQHQPDLAIAYFQRGLLWQQQQQFTAAITDYDRALSLHPDAASVHYYRGLAHQATQNLTHATTDLKLAAKQFLSRGNHSNAKKALRHLAKLHHPSTLTPPKRSPLSSAHQA